jgi:hypothetical protein
LISIPVESSDISVISPRHNRVINHGQAMPLEHTNRSPKVVVSKGELRCINLVHLKLHFVGGCNDFRSKVKLDITVVV